MLPSLAKAHRVFYHSLLKNIQVSSVLIFSPGCSGDDSSPDEEPLSLALSYYLQRVTTGEKQNTLIIEADPRLSYTYMLKGEGFEADIVKGATVPLKSRTILSYESEGVYRLNLTIFQKDESTLVQDSLTWEFNSLQPPEAVASFRETSTKEDSVRLFFSTNRGEGVDYFKISGDLKAGWLENNPLMKAKEGWFGIPEASSLEIPLSEGEGMKNFLVTLRNEFFNETESLELEVLRKTTGPANCRILPLSLNRASNESEFYISAYNDGPLYYKYRGTGVKESVYIETKGQLYTSIPLKNGEGPREVEILLKDDADNFCPPASFTIEVDYDYLDADFSFDTENMWTWDEEIKIFPHFDHFPHIATEMHISGGVADGPHTNRWISYSDEVTVRLTPQKGHRSVDVRYRNTRDRAASVQKHMFLKPFVEVQGSQPTYTLILSPFHHLKHLTVRGCEESYQQVPFSFSVPCTSEGSGVEVEYTMTDDSFVTVNQTFPGQ